MSASKLFSSQFKDVRQEKLRRRRRYTKRMEARAHFRRSHYDMNG
jgi:hypothetical protein